MNGRPAPGLRWASIPLWVPVAFLLTWQAVVWLRMLDPIFFPPPTRLLEVGASLAANGELVRDLAATLSRCAVGFAIGASLGLVWGVLMGFWAPLRRAFEPVINALYTTPKMTLLPLLMLLVGVGNSARLSLVALGVFLIVVINTVDGVRNVDPHYVELAVNYGANQRNVIRHVYLPASLPAVFTGLRLGLGRALVTTITIELVSSTDGLGAMVWRAWQTFTPEKLYVGVLLSACLGMLFHNILRAAERRLSPWREK